jgi:hypothetical protein
LLGDVEFQRKERAMSRKRVIVIGSIAAGIGIVAAVAIGAFALDNLAEPAPIEVEQPAAIEPPPLVDDGDDDTETLTVVRSGEFVDGDAVHRGSGAVSIVDDGEQVLLVFGDDVSITPGPDLLVYLSPNGPGEDLGEFVSLGTLTAADGAQAYVLPENYNDFRTVVIWCRAFAVTFATAELI